MRDLNQLDWKAPFDDAKELHIIVCEAVIRELDIHKISRVERRRKRARAALKTIEQASQLDEGLVLKEANPRVLMHVSLARVDWDVLGSSASDEPDDMLVAAAKQSSGAAIVLSHDTGPRLKARAMKLEAFAPLDEWLLQPEPSEESRRLTKIEREVESLKNQNPDLKLEISGLEDRVVTLTATKCPALGSKTIAQLTRFVLQRNPMEHVNATMRGPWAVSGLGEITGNDVAQYEGEYSTYRVEVERYFRELHQRVFLGTHVRALEVTVSNDGSASARNLSVSVEVEEPIRLMECREDAEKFGADVSLPEPPDAPRGGILERLVSMPSLTDAIRKPKNPTRFNWASEPHEDGDTFGSLMCQDFRPKRQAKLDFLLLVLELEIEALVTVEVSAEDQTTLREELTVKFEEGEADWAAAHVRDALPSDARMAFESLGSEHDLTK